MEREWKKCEKDLGGAGQSTQKPAYDRKRFPMPERCRHNHRGRATFDNLHVTQQEKTENKKRRGSRSIRRKTAAERNCCRAIQNNKRCGEERGKFRRVKKRSKHRETTGSEKKGTIRKLAPSETM